MDFATENPVPGMPRADSAIDLTRIEGAVREILAAIGEDPDRDGLQATPKRVAGAYAELLSGMYEDPAQHLHQVFDCQGGASVTVKDIPFFSLCEHHILPFFARCRSPTNRKAGRSSACRSWRDLLSRSRPFAPPPSNVSPFVITGAVNNWNGGICKQRTVSPGCAAATAAGTSGNWPFTPTVNTDCAASDATGTSDEINQQRSECMGSSCAVLGASHRPTPSKVIVAVRARPSTRGTSRA